MPDRLLLNRKVAAGLLITAYILLVGTVVVGGWWLTREFDQAEHDRCTLAASQLELTTVEIQILANPTGHLTPINQLDPELQQIIADLRTGVLETCPAQYLN